MDPSALLDNPHKVTVVGKADAEYDAKLEAREKEHVTEIVAALDDARKEEIVCVGRALRASQDSD